MKGALLVVVIIVLLGAGGWFLFQSTAPVTEPLEQGAGEVVEEAGLPDGQPIQMRPDTLPPTAGEAAPAAVQQAPATEPAAGTVTEGPVTISMDESGFTPATVTVAAGTAVTFVNNGQAPHWPASDVHPTHQILPAFDSKRGLATGEEYTFTFTDPGSWKFHDHLNPRLVGTVVVR